MPIGQFKAMWQCSDATLWPTLEPIQVAPPDDHILQLVQAAPPGGQNL